MNLPQQTYTGLEDIDLKRKREKEDAEAKRKRQEMEKRKAQLRSKSKPNPNSAFILLLIGAIAACGIYYVLDPSNYWQRLISITISTGLFGMFGFYFVQVYRRIG